MLMDADSVILLAQCLSNRYMPVCSFTFDFLGQAEFKGHGVQKLLNFLNVCTLYVFKHKKRPDTKIVLMCICVNKILNKESAILRYQISENMNQSTESIEISEGKNFLIKAK